MKKTTGYKNYRVTVEPRGLGNFGSVRVSDRMVSKDEDDRQKQYQERCHDIADQIKRHVDNIGIVSVDFDTFESCSHCGAEWTEKSDDYNGGCCDADEANNPNGEAAA